MTAFLPSSFAMYTTMLASSFWFHPATTTPTGTSRATRASLCFAVGAIIGWPFTAVLGVPFVIEQLFLTGGEVAVGAEKSAIRQKRLATMVKAIAIGASLAVSPTVSLQLFRLMIGPGVSDRLMGVRPLHLPHSEHHHLQPLLLRRRKPVRHFAVHVLLFQPLPQLQLPPPLRADLAAGFGLHVLHRSPPIGQDATSAASGRDEPVHPSRTSTVAVLHLACDPHSAGPQGGAICVPRVPAFVLQCRCGHLPRPRMAGERVHHNHEVSVQGE